MRGGGGRVDKVLSAPDRGEVYYFKSYSDILAKFCPGHKGLSKLFVEYSEGLILFREVLISLPPRLVNRCRKRSEGLPLNLGTF